MSIDFNIRSVEVVFSTDISHLEPKEEYITFEQYLETFADKEYEVIRSTRFWGYEVKTIHLEIPKHESNQHVNFYETMIYSVEQSNKFEDYHIRNSNQEDALKVHYEAVDLVKQETEKEFWDKNPMSKAQLLFEET